MAKVAVLLSGSGVYDGSELHEAVLTLFHLDDSGVDYSCFAPDISQLHVINHLKGEAYENQTRNVLEESARIARGTINNLSDIDVSKFDALVIPGGFGAAKNLCTFAIDGPDCQVEEETRSVIRSFYNKNKPIAPMCIAPALVAKVLGDKGVKIKVTIGNDPDTAKAIEAMGAEHVNCPVNKAVVDEKNKIVSTPAYMLGPSISDISNGIRDLVDNLLEMI